jgi:hypothetical protein
MHLVFNSLAIEGMCGGRRYRYDYFSFFFSCPDQISTTAIERSLIISFIHGDAGRLQLWMAGCVCARVCVCVGGSVMIQTML